MRQDLATSRPVMAAFAVIGLYWGPFAAMVPVLKAQIGASDGVFGLCMLVASVGALVAMWLAPLAERLLGRRAMPILGACVGISFLLPGLAHSVPVFAICMLLASMSAGCLDVVMNARLSTLERRSGRSLMNLNHGAYSLVYAAAAMTTGIARELGMHPVAIFACFGIVTLWMISEMIRLPVDVAPTDEDSADKAPLPAGPIWLAGSIILVAFFGENGTEGWSALYLERSLGTGAAGGALGPALLGLTMGLGRIAGQLVSARIDEYRLIRWAALIAASGALIAASAPVPVVAYIGFAALGLGISVIGPTVYVIVGRDVTDAARTHVIARISAIGYLGFFIAPPLMGFLSEWSGLSAAFGIVALLILAVPVALLPAYRRLRDGLSSRSN
ncbi:Predicted arabinose efflux permease, MFS family [Poseidonocella pacifica]|uniref:Predicted arabinose efflux permease, MFS family n=2 Tax=Poseidonocella pacifica TaxID=871651 RepID=A0A1I0VQ59_9RHOB|nr:Predicted arabinose efflux permease, MFS family [Poseidonocella pacifica]